MKRGEGIPGLVGWEWHGAPASIPGLKVVSKPLAKKKSKVSWEQFVAANEHRIKL